MSSYAAYGLRISSDVPLTEFEPASGPGDILVRYVKDTGWVHESPENSSYVEITSRRAGFWFSGVGSIVVRDGVSIDIDAIEGADENLIRLYIEGMMMAMLLHQRGFCVLHASVVNVAGRAIAFLGHVGAGKSSLAAAFVARGHALVSDDNAAVEPNLALPMVMPAYPYMKLYPEIAASLGYAENMLHPLHAGQVKVAGSACSNFTAKALPLDRLYFLGRGYPPEIQPITGPGLLLEMVRHSVPTRWGCRGDEAHLHRCGAVAGKVRGFTVRSFDTLSSLQQLASRLEEHCSAESAPPYARPGNSDTRAAALVRETASLQSPA